MKINKKPGAKRAQATRATGRSRTIPQERTQSKALGIYIHIPFCVRKCRYCDFLSFPITDEQLHDSYADKASEEIIAQSALYRNNFTVNTIFFGGGTPSLLKPETIDKLLDTVYARFRVAENTEITLEANPGTLTPEKLAAYKSIGLNRLSIGAQSFHPGVLKALGRIHSPQEIYDAARAATHAGFDNINLDMIFGLPNESFEIWKQDLATAIALDPAHISFYSLQIEEGTAIFRDVESGKVAPLADEEDRRMYHHAIGALQVAGYHHYEISNAAKRGRESRHNLKYWSQECYLGIGPSAHSYMNGVRFANTDSFPEYMREGVPSAAVRWRHKNSAADEISEYVFLGLRKTEGIDLDRFSQLFGRNFWELYADETQALISRGLLERDGQRLRLTALGLDLSNQVFMEFV